MAVIEVDGLTKTYGETVANDDLSFAVESGEVFGFLGPNGAGKTTCIRTLLGFQSPTSGTARVLGADVRDAAALREARADVGYLPAHPAFDGDVTGRRLLDYQASLKGDERREDLLELFDPPLDRKIREYSTGNRQMLAIVQAFMHDPDLVIMDEPTSGLDPLRQDAFVEFLRAERERGLTAFFSSHVLGEVRRVCDRVGILRAGRLVALEDVESLLERGGKRVRLQTAGELRASDLNLEGVRDLVPTDDGAQFTYTGDYDALIDHLDRFDLVDLIVEEPPLEDVFMHYYGAVEEGDGTGDGEGDGDGVGEGEAGAGVGEEDGDGGGGGDADGTGASTSGPADRGGESDV